MFAQVNIEMFETRVPFFDIWNDKIILTKPKELLESTAFVVAEFCSGRPGKGGGGSEFQINIWKLPMKW